MKIPRLKLRRDKINVIQGREKHQDDDNVSGTNLVKCYWVTLLVIAHFRYKVVVYLFLLSATSLLVSDFSQTTLTTSTTPLAKLHFLVIKQFFFVIMFVLYFYMYSNRFVVILFKNIIDFNINNSNINNVRRKRENR